MARPKKQKVYYFPHDTDASDGKTLTIIQNKFGNDGYAFWFKLLQLLGRTPGHYYNFNNAADWEFLLAKTHVSAAETALEILNLLAKLNAIDEELYKNGIIWSQNFVDRIADAYKRTANGIPQKPNLQDIKTVIADNNVVFAAETPKIDTKTSQNKNKNKIKYNNSDDGEIFKFYENEIGILTPISADELKDLLKRFPRDWIKDAIVEAVQYNARNLKYINAILENRKAGNTKPKGDIRNGKAIGKNNGAIRKPNEFTDPDDYFRERRNEH